MHPEKPETHVDVAVITTSGRWPTAYERVPAHQKVRIVLSGAARALEIASTEGWIATVRGTEINPDASFIENGLTGQILIDYGPREGGGGA